MFCRLNESSGKDEMPGEISVMQRGRGDGEQTCGAQVRATGGKLSLQRGSCSTDALAISNEWGCRVAKFDNPGADMNVIGSPSVRVWKQLPTTIKQQQQQRSRFRSWVGYRTDINRFFLLVLFEMVVSGEGIEPSTT